MANGISAEYAAARAANEKRYAQMMGIYDEIIGRTQRGGAFEKAGLGEIERARTKGVGQEMQQMISSGMYGTTTAAGVPARWEAEVGAPARLRLEDIMEQRLSTAQLGKAGAIERREDVYPDVGAYAQYAGQAAQAGGGRTPTTSLSAKYAGVTAPLEPSPTFTRTPTKAAPTPPPVTRREIPAQYTPTAMESYLKTYTAQTGDYSKVSSSRQIPAQTTPTAMKSYLETYIPQTGDYSKVPQVKKKTTKPKSIYDEYADYFGI